MVFDKPLMTRIYANSFLQFISLSFPQFLNNKPRIITNFAAKFPPNPTYLTSFNEDVPKVVIPIKMKESLNLQILRINRLLRRFSSQ